MSVAFALLIVSLFGCSGAMLAESHRWREVWSIVALAPIIALMIWVVLPGLGV